MNLPDYLSDDQREALVKVLESIERRQQTVLVGPAGSGKSTLTREIVSLCERRSVLAAPTGKAALVLSGKSGRAASTIHRRLYGGAVYDREAGKLVFTRPDAACAPEELLIIDESSMVGTKLYADLLAHLPRSARVLWVADKEQLPPVNDTWGPPLDEPTAELTQVHRQAAKSQIIRYCTAVREGRGDSWEANEYDERDPNLAVYGDLQSAVDWVVHARTMDDDATLITYTHKVREEINQRVRSALSLDAAKLSVGDKLVVRTNNHTLGLMNGEVVTVRSISSPLLLKNQVYSMELDEIPGLEILVDANHIEKPAQAFQDWKQGMKKKEADRYLHVHYGQCLTVHSSQGSQWKKVGFIADSAYRRMKNQDRETGRRFLYTAITRAEEALAVFMV